MRIQEEKLNDTSSSILNFEFNKEGGMSWINMEKLYLYTFNDPTIDWKS